MSDFIGKIIENVFNDSGLSVSELARKIQTTRQNMYGIFKRKSIDTELLTRLGIALNYDFFPHFIKKSIGYKDENLPPYQKKERRNKVVLQIELDDEKQEEVLKLVLGNTAYIAFKKQMD